MLVQKIVLSVLWVLTALVCGWLAFASKNGTLKRNSFCGYRLPVTQKNDETWRAAHKASWKWTAMMALGPAIGAIGTMFAGSDQVILYWTLVVLVPTTVSCVGGTIVAVRAAKKVLADTQLKG